MGDEGRPTASWWRGAAATAVALVLAVGLFLALWLLARPLALLLAAIILADAVKPAVDWLERRLPDAVAVGLTYLLLVLAVAGLGWIVVPRLVAQAVEVLANAPALLDRAQGVIDRRAPEALDAAIGSLGPWLRSVGERLLETPLVLIQFAAETLLMLAMAIYFSLASDELGRFVFGLVPGRHRDQAIAVTREVVATMGGYLRARVIVAVIIAVVVYVGLLLIGVQGPLILALLAGLGELIPYLGPTAAAVPAVAIALLGSPAQAILVLVLYIAVQQLKGIFIVPTVVRQQADIPPLLVIFALLVGTSVGGVIGALVAPPLAGALRVLVVRVLAPPLQRRAGPAPPGAERPEDVLA